MEPITTAAITAAATAGGIAALKKSVGKVFEQMSARAPALVAENFARWKAKRSVQVAAERLFHLRMVKTIWQIDKPVDITDFYHPSKLRVNQAKPVIVSRISDIPHAGNVIVQGTVGQGKSIFLRHLATIEALDGVRLPIFIELRRLLADDTLSSHITSELSTLGMPTGDEVFSYLASSGQMALLLDAFDEVREERRERLISELETLARRHPELPIIITSRQNSGIERSSLWAVVQLVPLTGNEYEEVVRRICHDDKVSAPIIGGLATETGKRITPMLTTPLMVALLVLRYRADQSIPETRADFFTDLFMLLLQRHDKTKAGYIRERKSKLGDKFLERVFIAICYLTKRRGEAVFSNSTMFDVTREALRIAGASTGADVDAVLDDIRLITCLLLEEGGEWRFLHKFVQEYHAACFVASFEDVAAQKFYDAMVAAPERWSAWREELGFLESIDAYRCARMYLIPMLEKLFGDQPSTYDVEAVSESASNWLGVLSEPAHSNKKTVSRKPVTPRVGLVIRDAGGLRGWYVYRLIELGFDFFSLSAAIRQAIGTVEIRPSTSTEEPCATLAELGCHTHPSVASRVQKMVQLLWQDLNKRREFVASVESRRALVAF